MTVKFLISEDSTIADVRALMDSYSVEVLKDSLVIFRGPLHACEMIERGPFEATKYQAEKLWDFTFPVIDESLELRLIQYEPPTEEDALEGIHERATRWPFFVNSPLVIHFAIGEQWWQWTFTPGKVYDVRSIAL